MKYCKYRIKKTNVFYIIITLLLLTFICIYTKKRYEMIHMLSQPYIEIVRSDYYNKIPKGLTEKEFFSYKIDGTTPKNEIVKRAKKLEKRYNILMDMGKILKIPDMSKYNINKYNKWEEFNYIIGDLELCIKNDISKNIKDDEVLLRYYNKNIRNYKKSNMVEANIVLYEKDKIISSENIKYDEGNIRDMTETYGELIEEINKLNVMQIKNIKYDDGINITIKCIKKEDGGYVPFEDIRGAIRSQYTSNIFDKKMEEGIKNGMSAKKVMLDIASELST